MPPDSLDTNQEVSSDDTLTKLYDATNAAARKTKHTNDLELPSFSPFYEYKRYTDINALDEHGKKIALHRCILAAQTNYFHLDSNHSMLTITEEDTNFIEAIYDSDESDNRCKLRLYTPLESRFARLNLFATGRYSDLKLVGDDGEIHAHRILLASGSELMRAMLIGSWRESSSPTIRMTELTHDQLRECCRWIYARVMPDWSTPTKKVNTAYSSCITIMPINLSMPLRISNH